MGTISLSLKNGNFYTGGISCRNVATWSLKFCLSVSGHRRLGRWHHGEGNGGNIKQGVAFHLGGLRAIIWRFGVSFGRVYAGLWKKERTFVGES